jgi:hypothetical protein
MEENRDLREEIKMMRVVTRRLLEAAQECKEVGELSNLLNTLYLPQKSGGSVKEIYVVLLELYW